MDLFCVLFTKILIILSKTCEIHINLYFSDLHLGAYLLPLACS